MLTKEQKVKVDKALRVNPDILVAKDLPKGLLASLKSTPQREIDIYINDIRIAMSLEQRPF